MKENMNNNEEELEIDLLKLLNALWRKAWAIVLAAALFGGAALAYWSTPGEELLVVAANTMPA